jgi:hypothetical protein
MTANPRSLVRIAAAGMMAALVLVLPQPAGAQGVPHAALLQAYRQSVTYLTSTLQQANRLAAIDATVTVIAVHRALTSGIATDVARIQAAGQKLTVGEGPALTQITAAEIERSTHIMFAGNWIGAGNPSARQAALDGAQTAIAATEAALAALAPVLQRVQTVTPLPPALVLGATQSRQANGTFLVVVTMQNAGGQAAVGTTISLAGDDSPSPSQEAQLGALAPGATLQHVFAVALPATEPRGTVSVSVEASNATSVVTLVDLE